MYIKERWSNLSIIFLLRKLTKILSQSGQQWTSIIQQAVLKINSTKKRAIGTTPFKIMFGRESQHIQLLEEVQFFYDGNSDIGEDYREDMDDTTLKNLQCHLGKEEREETWSAARESIIREQLKQKQIFDRKVHERSYVNSLLNI